MKIAGLVRHATRREARENSRPTKLIAAPSRSTFPRISTNSRPFHHDLSFGSTNGFDTITLTNPRCLILEQQENRPVRRLRALADDHHSGD